ncbi:MAG: family 10 glycosylhydrolase [Armatimonadetes bacterium]|nr:family 10 glycosylhydrolase [Armatimonadota bacterium]
MALSCLPLIVAAALQSPTQGIVPREFRAVWVATVDNIDWPSKPGLPAEEQKRELDGIVDRCAELGINAIVFQVRPMCDALYRSEIEPWSWYLTGEQGRDPGYDPLERLIGRAHAKGIEVHAWFNPYRAKHPSMKGELAPSHVGARNLPWVATYGNHLWLDPGSTEAQNHTLRVVEDVVRRYDVDAVHMDDYFYPYPVAETAPDGTRRNVPFPDAESYAKYRERGGTLALEDWRRQNVDRLIEQIARRAHRAKPWVRFGISPFGIYRPGFPPEVRAGFDQYAQLYADPLKWFRNGWCDYLAPQLYWRIGSPQPFPALLNWWLGQNAAGRHVWPGLFTSQVQAAGWPVQEIADQIGLTREAKANGHIHFSYKAFRGGTVGAELSQTLAELYARRALSPATPWLDPTPPAKPRVRVKRFGDRLRIDWGGSQERGVRWWVLLRRSAEGWEIVSTFGSEERQAELPAKSDGLRLVAVSRTGVESVPATVVP